MTGVDPDPESDPAQAGEVEPSPAEIEHEPEEARDPAEEHWFPV